MKGFFNKDSISTQVDPKNPQSCASCGLYKGAISPRMKPYGKFKKEIAFIGEAPGSIEDRRGKPWQGRVGRLLQETLKEMGINMFRDGVSFNACNCRPQGNETPSPNQIYCCRSSVLKYLKKYRPKVIILFGNTPIQSIIGSIWGNGLGGVERWRGWNIPDQQIGSWICPTYHPSFVTRNEEKGGKNLAKFIWKRDLFNALQLLDKPFPHYPDPAKSITYVESNKHLKSILPKLMNAEFLSFDYEATSLKPHYHKQKLVSVAAAISPTECYAWMNNKVRAKLWKKVLQSPVPKVAHNLQMEEEWSYQKIGTSVNNWLMCTMNGAHCLDNRRRIAGLKFQSYVNFGRAGYDSEVSSYLKSDPKEGAFGSNKIFQFIHDYGERELLKYNGIDSLEGWKIAYRQRRILHAS